MAVEKGVIILDVTLSHPIFPDLLSYFGNHLLSYLTLSSLILSYLLFNPILSYPLLLYSITYPILSYPISSYHLLSNPILSFLLLLGLADGRLNVWYQPFIAFTDRDLVPLTTSSAEAKGIE